MSQAAGVDHSTDENDIVAVTLMAAADLPGVIALFNEYRCFYGQRHDIALAEQFIHERFDLQDSWILVAKANGDAVVGFCQTYPGYSSISVCRIGILNDLFVAAHARSRGVGSALLRGAESLAASLGLGRLELSTARENYSARMLYARHGWLPTDDFISYQKAITLPHSAS